ncbi:sugar ABC transporter ATP-binding protein [Microbacterium maritypicum]|uniref:sugar ABC transporter ATP-binding protein n=1 Tax=Microbacterium maritypicum TaxID=33918 RepID=UPI00382D607C
MTTLETPTDGTFEEPRLRMEHVSKAFGRNIVLRDAGVEVLPGEIHALLGQNGSGKSTVIKVLSGLYRPDPGAIVQVDGVDVPQPISPAGAMSLGLTFIHQSLGLIPGHSVTENVRLASLERRKFGRFIDWKYERRCTAETLESMNASGIDPDAIVDHLHMGQRATVAIARALQTIVPGKGLVVLDESTQSLSREVLPDFYETIRTLAARGTSILMVSHRLDEVLALADRATILRDGAVAAAGIQAKGMSEAALAQEILGRQLVTFSRSDEIGERPEIPTLTAPIRIRGLEGEFVRGLDLDIQPGEVVGVTGRTEAGHEEIPYLITGASRPERGGGTVEIDGGGAREVSKLTVARSRADGAVLVPSDRIGQGVAVSESALDNLTLPRIKERAKLGFIGRAWRTTEFEEANAILKITPPLPELPLSSFSGGNQQKILLAKWLLDAPKLLVLHEPTQAVDVGARADILHAVSESAKAGAAVLLSSIESQDLAFVCDRVVILEDGKAVRELTRPFTSEDLLEAIG